MWENIETFQQEKKERRKIERVSPHRAPVSSLSPLRCLNNHKNLHTVHRNGLKEKVDQENKTKHRKKKKTDHIKTLKHTTRKKPIAKKKVRTHQWCSGRFMSRPSSFMSSTTRPALNDNFLNSLHPPVHAQHTFTIWPAYTDE